MKSSEIRNEIREQIGPHLEWHWRRIIKENSGREIGFNMETMKRIPLTEKTMPFQEFVKQIPKQKLASHGAHWRHGLVLKDDSLGSRAWLDMLTVYIGNCRIRVYDNACALAMLWNNAGRRFAS